MLQQLLSAVLENPTGLFFDCANEFIDFKGSRKKLYIDWHLEAVIDFLEYVEEAGCNKDLSSLSNQQSPSMHAAGA
ncbi:hypothetical protein ACFXTH_026247 [Malus domestica]